jgi:hypothetical protein
MGRSDLRALVEFQDHITAPTGRPALRTEPATNNVYTDYGVGKAVENLPLLREKLDGIIDRYLDVQ